MIDAVIRDGYCVAQEYLPAAPKGDVRLFVMNGRPLKHDGKYAAFRRVNKTGDARSNMHSGGESEPVEVTDKMLRLVEIVRPKLVSDGMFLVGLDIVEDKLIEINVFSPGGLGSSSEFAGIDFCEVVIHDLERKVQAARVLRRPHDEHRAGDAVALWVGRVQRDPPISLSMVGLAGSSHPTPAIIARLPRQRFADRPESPLPFACLGKFHRCDAPSSTSSAFARSPCDLLTLRNTTLRSRRARTSRDTPSRPPRSSAIRRDS